MAMSQKTPVPAPHRNNNVSHYLSKSTDDFNEIQESPDVTNLLDLINSVVDRRDTKTIIANVSASHIPRTFRKKRPRSASAIISATQIKQIKAHTRRKPPQLLSSSHSNSTNSGRNAAEHTSPRSYSPFPDYKDLHETKYPSTHSSTPSSNDGTAAPKMSHHLSTILSCRLLEDDNNTQIDREYDMDSHEADANNMTDPRSKQECKRIMFLYNSKSGGRKALTLLQYFRAYTSLIYDLLELNSSPQELRKLAHDLTVYEHKIVICIVGGDGSQCWATSLIDKALFYTKSIMYPTIVPFPVGTGNDLSRSLGWGNLERTPDKIIKHITDVEYCFNLSKRFSVLDRWSINYTFDEQISSTFSPPLPTTFMCYLSFGYDAMITYNFAKERKMYPKRFKSQLANQTVYFKMGLKELVKPSAPVNDCILLEIDGKVVDLPRDTRSLKLVNINSAANGVFFWGYLKSNKDELQRWKRPQLNDGLIEVMATRGSAKLVEAKMRMGHAHRLGQSNDVLLKVIKTPVYLQIDGEGWCIEDECTLHIQLHDQLPTLIGYKFPRGVYHKYETQYYTDEEKEARHRYRDVIRRKYNIPRLISCTITPTAPPQMKKQSSRDDFDLRLCDDGDSSNSIEQKEQSKQNRSMSEIKLNKEKRWKPLFANKNSCQRNRSDHKDGKKKKKKKTKNVPNWF